MVDFGWLCFSPRNIYISLRISKSGRNGSGEGCPKGSRQYSTPATRWNLLPSGILWHNLDVVEMAGQLYLAYQKDLHASNALLLAKLPLML